MGRRITAGLSVNRKEPIAYDRAMYKWRHLVENFFAAIKEGREPNASVAQVLPCYRTLHQLEQHGIHVSTGAACSSNKKGKSHVLQALGRTEKEIDGALRFSFSEFNTMEQMDEVLDRLINEVAKFRKLGSFR